ncbi:condensation domain-containing protein, partial [Streptomyces griseoviridis]|uniref:condensation domain-containing protein n=1 Tax=Streptomyces TaxID=1883 RepID=UPI002476D164
VTEQEKILAALFTEVLGLERVGVDDSFFELGGDSISSIQLVARARAAGLMVSARDVFQSRTVAELAAVVAAAGPETAGDAGGESAAEWVGPVGLSPVVQWLRERGGPVDGFRQAVLLRVPAGLGLERLTAAVDALVERHEALRMRLDKSDEWSLEVLPAGVVPVAECVRRVDIAGLSAQAAREVIAAEAEAAGERLAHGRGVMLQAVWFDAGDEAPGRLLVAIHHLAVDGVSWRILLPDLAHAWSAAANGQKPHLERTGTSFGRWVEHLHSEALSPRRETEAAAWVQVLSDGSEDGIRLGDRPLEAGRDVRAEGGNVSLVLSVADTEPLLTQVPAVFNGRVQEVLLAALGLAVADCNRRRGQSGSRVLVDVEGHGREDIAPGVDLSDTVGWFTSIFPVCLDTDALDLDDALAGGPAAGILVKRVKEHLRRLPDNGLGYGLLRYLNPRTSTTLHDLEQTARPQISFNYLGRFTTTTGTGTGTGTGNNGWEIDSEGGAVGGMDPQTPFTHILDINALVSDTEHGPQLSVSWAWPQTLLPHETVEDLAHTWTKALQAITRYTQRPDAGGFTPSDLPLLTLTQDDINELESELGLFE